MEESLRALLTGHAPLVALVDQRIYWNTIAQSAGNPAVVMFFISGGPGYHMQGSDGLVSARVQIDVRDTTLTVAWAAARVIKALLSGYRGTVTATDFRGIFLLSERQYFDKDSNSAEAFHVVSLDFDVWSRQAAA